MKKFWTTTFLWGSIWGAAEATLGYLLHLIPGIAGSIMFPIGLFCIHRAVLSTNTARAIPFVTLFAASFKLLDLLLPSWHIGSVINPAMAIILEGLTVSIFLYLMKHSKNGLIPAAVTAILWRALFISFLALRSSTGMFSQGIEKFILLSIIGITINVILITLIIKLEQYNSFRKTIEKIQPWKTTVAGVFLFALSAELLLRSL